MTVSDIAACKTNYFDVFFCNFIITKMLNDHMLVRIGGGWDTLEHYLMTHAPSKEGIKGKMILFSSGLYNFQDLLSLSWEQYIKN